VKHSYLLRAIKATGASLQAFCRKKNYVSKERRGHALKQMEKGGFAVRPPKLCGLDEEKPISV